MSGEERRRQVLGIAAVEFAEHGLHGASTEAIARSAGITQAYIFRLFGTKKALFIELVTSAFERTSSGMLTAGSGRTGIRSLERMGTEYYDLLADRTALLLQLQGLAACGDAEVKEAVRERFARMWQVVSETTSLDPVTVKTFLAFGMLLNVGAALDLEQIDETWAEGMRTRIRPGLFAHISDETNR
ncbi:TetR family transcriptional regulator [Brevibacterium casei S18]|uniref:TetR family transcriptional regulator n=2 Tax=Brevibacteriaceae TaxID=85019 RepID=K9AFF1_9MICO|nr:TetR family transcriptional regulator [Brevibacterium casei S18]